jgi:dUTP pyrophosphatase
MFDSKYLENIRKRILDVADASNPYSQEDFDVEFSRDIKTDFTKMELKFVNKSNNEDPEYATVGSSGFDLRANLSEEGGNVTINAGKRYIVPTGLFFEIPENFEIQVRPRSGLAAKNGVTVLNTPGTIDSDYRGEIKVILINLGDEDFVINHGDRIAQAVFAPVYAKNVLNLKKVNEINTNTERGEGRFGSTGKI